MPKKKRYDCIVIGSGPGGAPFAWRLASKKMEVLIIDDFFNPSHIFGTCRMGKDPEKSVVGPDLRSHEINNLFVADASVFP